MKRQSLFRFDEPYRRFELLESERGTPEDGPATVSRPAPPPDNIPSGLDAVQTALRKQFRAETNPDLILRPFRIGGRTDALAAFLNGMADGKLIDDFLLGPGMAATLPKVLPHPERYLQKNVFTVCEASESRDFAEAIRAITEGRTALFLEGRAVCLLFDTRGYASRSVGTPENEPVVLGPHEAFNENLRTNITLLRRILKTPSFVASFRPTEDGTGRQLALCYADGVIHQRLLAEIQRRLASVRADRPLSVGMIEQAIEDYPWLPLPQTLKTERPDRVAAAIADGKAAILIEGSPIACVLPVTLGLLFSSAEDAAVRRPVGTLLRVVRAVGCVLSVWMPAYFLALAEHHAGQLSGEVLSVVLSSHVMVFLPMPVEMIFLLLVFQLVREAGVRVPGVVGHAIGIIGGLLLGQAAVAAHLVSTIALIIVALSGLGNFTIPDYSTQICIAYYRIALCVSAALGGFVGLGTVTLFTIAGLCSVKSFGVPMLAPFAPKTRRVRPFLQRGKAPQNVGPQDMLNAEGRL